MAEEIISSKAKYALEQATKAIAELTQEVTRLEVALDERVGIVQQLIDCPLRRVVYSTARTAYASPALAKAEAERAYEKACPIAEQNEQIAEANRLIVQRLTELMKNAGVPSTRLIQANKRYPPKFVTVQVEWAQALSQNVPTSTPWRETCRLYAEWLKACDADIAKKEQERRQEAEARERKEKQFKAQLVRGKIAEKYGLPITADRYDITHAICAKSQILRLAVAMEETRGDWSDGLYRVRAALDLFAPTDDWERRVAESISDILRGDEEDGRIFRDCTYNYNVLFERLPAELVADYRAVQEGSDAE